MSLSGGWNGPVPGAGSRLAGSVPSATMRCTASVVAADAIPGVVPVVASRRLPGGALIVSAVEGPRMSTPRRAGLRALAIMLALAAILVVASVPSTATAQDGAPTLEWFGWSHFRLTSVA